MIQFLIAYLSKRNRTKWRSLAPPQLGLWLTHWAPQTPPYQPQELYQTRSSASGAETLNKAIITITNYKIQDLRNSIRRTEYRESKIECSNWGHTLLLEVVISLEARAEAIDGLAGLADPESDGVDCSSEGPHLRRSELEVSGECEIRGESRFLSLSWGCESKAWSFLRTRASFEKWKPKVLGRKRTVLGSLPH